MAAAIGKPEEERVVKRETPLRSRPGHGQATSGPTARRGSIRVMAAPRRFTVNALVPLLRDRDIDLSASQVHRLASGNAGAAVRCRLLAALGDLVSCSPADLPGSPPGPRTRPTR